jgi:hypothetical protein
MIIQGCAGEEIYLLYTISGPYSLVEGSPSGVSMAGGDDGAIVVSIPGIYIITITNGEQSETFTVSVEDCTPALLQSEFIYCTGSGTITQQLYDQFGNPLTGATALEPVPAGVSVSSAGVMTVNTSTTTQGLFYVSSGELQYLVVVGVVVCPTPTVQNRTDCDADTLGIVWVNQQGGRQSFWFNQIKEFGIRQQGGVKYINAQLEQRYTQRGRVEDRVQIIQEFVNETQLAALVTLLNSIQAWACTDIANQATYRSIIIDEQTFKVRRTNDRFFTVSFDFSYSIARNIQRQ